MYTRFTVISVVSGVNLLVLGAMLFLDLKNTKTTKDNKCFKWVALKPIILILLMLFEAMVCCRFSLVTDRIASATLLILEELTRGVLWYLVMLMFLQKL